MKTNKTLVLIGLAFALAACGDNLQRPDARKPPDGPPADAICSNCPAAPALGTQVDRMGRPAINTALNHEFDPASGAAAAGAAKDAYNANSDPSTWSATAVIDEFKKSLALLDSLDTNLCGNGACEAGEIGATATCSTGTCAACTPGGSTLPTTPCICAADCTTTQVGTTPTNGGGGCGNQVLYDGGGGSSVPGTTSYETLANLLSQDELYLDTTKTTCTYYLAVEFGVVTGSGNTTCGGRAPQYDVIDYSFSMLAMGLKGFTLPDLLPLFKDNANAHMDYTSTFPYLGAPH